MRSLVVVTGLLFAVIFFTADTPKIHAQTPQNQQPQTVQPTEAKKVEVQPGDSLAKIATENETTYLRLYDANTQIQDPDLIYPGSSIRIPKPDEQLESRPLPGNAPPAVVQVSRESKKPVKQPKAAQPAPAAVYSNDGSVWDRLAQCESGGNWAINTGNGYYGGLQFSLSSWKAVGGSGYPNQASKAEQIARGAQLQARQGWGAWPACTSKLGIR